MTSLFGKKNRSSASSSAASHGATSPTGLAHSVPYNQLAPSGPPPVAGPSYPSIRGADGSRLISPPTSNPTLTDNGTPMNVSRRYDGMPPPAPARRRTGEDMGAGAGTGAGSRRSNATDPGGRLSPDVSMSGGPGSLGRSTAEQLQYTPPELAYDPSSSTSLRYPAPSSTFNASTMGRSATPISATPIVTEFGGGRHPYAMGYGSGRDTDATSIRTVSSMASSVRSPRNGDGRYPDHQTMTQRQMAPGMGGAGGRSTPVPGGSSSSHLPMFSTPTPTPSKDGSLNRPPDEEIERMYEDVLRLADLDPAQHNFAAAPRASVSSTISTTPRNPARSAMNVTIETKWQLVQNHYKKKDHRAGGRDETPRAKGRKGGKERAHPVEYYLTVAMKRQLTVEILLSLEISLRSETLDWIQNFRDHKGVMALVNCLRPLVYTELRCSAPNDIDEKLIVCLRQAIGHDTEGLREAVNSRMIIEKLMPYLTCRNLVIENLVAEILIAVCRVDERHSRLAGISNDARMEYIYHGFAFMERRFNEGVSNISDKVARYTMWFREIIRVAKTGRGRMGSAVGKGSELKGVDVVAWLSNALYLIEGLLLSEHEKTRIHLRLEFHQCGLPLVFDELRAYNIKDWNDKMDAYASNAQNDRENFADDERYNALLNLTTPQDIIKGLLAKNQGSGGGVNSYLLNMLRHMAIIEQEGEERTRYFQLLDQLVSTVVMASTPDLKKEFEHVFGSSIQRVLGKVVEQERMEAALRESKRLRMALDAAEKEKAALQEEISAGDDGLVGRLKAEVADLKEKLNKAWAASEAKGDENEKMKESYEGRITGLSDWISHLLQMLSEASNLDEILDRGGGWRRDLYDELQGNKGKPYDDLFVRNRGTRTLKETLRSLEGRRGQKGVTAGADGGDVPSAGVSDEEDEADEAGEVTTAEKIALGGNAKGLERTVNRASKRTSRRHKAFSGSQFEDAGDDSVRLHIEESLSKGADTVSPAFRSPGVHSSSRRFNESGTGRRPFDANAPPIGEKAPARMGLRRGGENHPSLPPRFLEELRFKQVQRSSSMPAGLSEEAAKLKEDKAREEKERTRTIEEIQARERELESGEGSEGAEGEGEDDDYRDSAYTQRTTDSGYPSGMSGMSAMSGLSTVLATPRNRNSFGQEVLTRAKSLKHGKDDEGVFPEHLSTVQEGEEGSSLPGMSGVLAGIKGNINLRKTTSPTPPPPPPPPSAPAPPNAPARAPLALNGLLYGSNDSRKEVENVASKKMKQLQWDKVSKAQLGKTVWGAEALTQAEQEAEAKLKQMNIWSEIENQFKAKEVMYDAIKKRKEKEEKGISVLAADHRKRIELLLAGPTSKNIKEPEELANKIQEFDRDLCSETFLSELQGVLPNDDDRGKLMTHSASTVKELANLHLADRLLLRLIQMPHLNDRIKGMLYRVRFDQNFSLLEQSLDTLVEGCKALQNATQFQAVLALILTMGNYLNGSNYAGGAFGFKIASINKLVDTKSSGGLNLLHFLEKTISTTFPDIANFLDELEMPSQAARVNYADMQGTSKHMLEDIAAIADSLARNFDDDDSGYAQHMRSWLPRTKGKIYNLRQEIVLANNALREVQTYYGEAEDVGRMMQSQDFFKIFSVFSGAYRACQAQNRERAEAEAATIARRIRAEKEKAARQERLANGLTAQMTGVSIASSQDMLDGTLMGLKKATPRIVRTSRPHRSAAPPSSPPPDGEGDFSQFQLGLDAEMFAGVEGAAPNEAESYMAQRLLAGVLDLEGSEDGEGGGDLEAQARGMMEAVMGSTFKPASIAEESGSVSGDGEGDAEGDQGMSTAPSASSIAGMLKPDPVLDTEPTAVLAVTPTSPSPRMGGNTSGVFDASLELQGLEGLLWPVNSSPVSPSPAARSTAPPGAAEDDEADEAGDGWSE